MKQMLITVGIPGSGKTTFAKELCNKDHSFVRVNRDSLREMLVGYNNFFKRDDTNVLENIISEVLNMTIITSLKTKNVIVDNTHLSWVYIKQLLDLAVQEDTFVCIKTFDVNLNVAQNRVYRRDNEVYDDEQEYIDYSGENSVQYIEAQYNRYEIFKENLEHLIKTHKIYELGKIIWQ